MSDASAEKKIEELAHYTAGLMLGVAALCIKLDELGVFSKSEFSESLAKVVKGGDPDRPSVAALRDLSDALQSEAPPSTPAWLRGVIEGDKKP